MTSAVQRSREALGLRLRQLRKDHEEGLTVRAFAERLGWPHSKVSKIETGRQTPSRSDLSAWCGALGRGDAAGELVRMLASLESLYREYRHQLRTGARALQSALGDLETRTDTLRIVETAVIPGLLQTPDYARAMIAESIEFFGAHDDLDAGVAQRMARQAILYDLERRFHFVIAEAALWHRVASPEVMAAQADRLVPLTASRNVRLGIIPLAGEWRLSPAHPFWIYDDQIVAIETIAAELRLTQPEEIAAYERAFAQYAASAVYGLAARRVLAGVVERLAGASEQG